MGGEGGVGVTCVSTILTFYAEMHVQKSVFSKLHFLSSTVVKNEVTQGGCTFFVSSPFPSCISPPPP